MIRKFSSFSKNLKKAEFDDFSKVERVQKIGKKFKYVWGNEEKSFHFLLFLWPRCEPKNVYKYFLGRSTFYEFRLLGLLAILLTVVSN